MTKLKPMISGNLTLDLVERAQSNEFEHWCRNCYVRGAAGSDERMGAMKRLVILNWEHEYGDFGTVLSTYPEFEVKPPCSGPTKYPQWSDRESEQKYDLDCATGMPSDWLDDDEPEPSACPFHPYFDHNYDHPDVVEILAAYRERKAFANMLGVRNHA